MAALVGMAPAGPGMTPTRPGATRSSPSVSGDMESWTPDAMRNWTPS